MRKKTLEAKVSVASPLPAFVDAAEFEAWRKKATKFLTSYMSASTNRELNDEVFEFLEIDNDFEDEQ